ncbi:hypothetical protein ABZP36_008704 [Zizania latifolia]
MADLAMGAVTKLLGAIHNEALVLGRVKGDVQFIKDEMESINSFLSELTSRAAPNGVDGPENEQVRTWMKQVRDLAHDCSNCIDDLYLHEYNPAVHRAARGGLWRYLGRVAWFLQGVVAKHKAANTLSELKERARDVSERRSRIEEIKSKIGPIEKDWCKNKSDKLLAMLCQTLKFLMVMPDRGMSVSREEMIEEAAFMLQCHMEAVDDKLPIILRLTQYQDILQKVFPASNKAQEAITTSARTEVVFSDEVIKEIKEISHTIRQLLPKPQLPEQEAKGITNNDVATAADIEEVKGKLHEIKEQMENELRIKGIADRISEYLENQRTLILLQDDKNFISNWLETRNALGLVGCAPGSAVIVTTKNNSIQRARELCCPQGEPVTYSLVGRYYYMALELTRERKNNKQQQQQQQDDGSCYDRETLHAILVKCDPHEFAMKIFVHDLYVNPDRSNQDLVNLLGELHSVGASSSSSTANTVMLKFCYNNLPRDYMTCLLHLAIFPRGHSIRRSTVVGRWVAEGLITKQDWPGAVRHAERCFDALIDTCLVQPNGVGDQELHRG